MRKAITGVQGRIPLHVENGEPEDMPLTDFSRRGAP